MFELGALTCILPVMPCEPERAIVLTTAGEFALPPTPIRIDAAAVPTSTTPAAISRVGSHRRLRDGRTTGATACATGSDRAAARATACSGSGTSPGTPAARTSDSTRISSDSSATAHPLPGQVDRQPLKRRAGSRLDRPQRQSQPLGDLALRQILVVGQRDHLALPGRQA